MSAQRVTICRRKRWQLVRPACEQGLTSLEFAVVLAIIGVLAYFLLQGLLFIQAQAERQAFDDNRAALERALSYELMSRGTRGEAPGAAMASQNPFQWLEPKPLGWAGEYPAPGRAIAGAWYWDSRRAEVVYVPKDPARVSFTENKQHEIRLRVDLAGGRASLVPVRPFVWR
jgi:type II secretory pathway pseudopilin PulG